MWFKQYELVEQGIIYIIWLSESGSYFQSSLTPRLELEQYNKIS